jgi:hypothetical protein
MDNSLSIPELASEFDLFQNNAVTIFTAKATTYGILPAALTGLAPMTAKWNGYVSACEIDSTKGVGATENRNLYQPIYAAAIRSIIELYLLNNVDVLPADALTLNIHTPTGKHVSMLPPTSTVVAKVSYKETLAMYFSFTDSVSGKKAKPIGVVFVQLAYVVDVVPPVSVTNCAANVFINRANNKITFASTDVGKKAYCYGRYVNRNGKFGPWCAMFSATII